MLDSKLTTESGRSVSLENKVINSSSLALFKEDPLAFYLSTSPKYKYLFPNFSGISAKRGHLIEEAVASKIPSLNIESEAAEQAIDIFYRDASDNKDLYVKDIEHWYSRNESTMSEKAIKRFEEEVSLTSEMINRTCHAAKIVESYGSEIKYQVFKTRKLEGWTLCGTLDFISGDMIIDIKTTGKKLKSSDEKVQKYFLQQSVYRYLTDLKASLVFISPEGIDIMEVTDEIYKEKMAEVETLLSALSLFLTTKEADILALQPKSFFFWTKERINIFESIKLNYNKNSIMTKQKTVIDIKDLKINMGQAANSASALLPHFMSLTGTCPKELKGKFKEIMKMVMNAKAELEQEILQNNQ